MASEEDSGLVDLSDADDDVEDVAPVDPIEEAKNPEHQRTVVEADDELVLAETPADVDPEAGRESSEPEEEAEPTEEAEGEEGEKPTWDQERQAKDQELAALRKENEALKTAKPSEVAAGTKAYTEAKGYSDEDVALRAEVVAEVGEELGELPPLPPDIPERPDEWATEADRAVYDKAVRENLGATRKIEEERRKREIIVAERVTAVRNRKAAERLYDDGVKILGKTGEEHRNELVDRVKKHFAEQGFGERLPDPAHTEDIVKAEAWKLKFELVQEGKAKAPKVQPSKDSGRGGVAVTERPRGDATMDDAVADLKRGMRSAGGLTQYFSKKR